MNPPFTGLCLLGINYANLFKVTFFSIYKIVFIGYVSCLAVCCCKGMIGASFTCFLYLAIVPDYFIYACTLGLKIIAGRSVVVVLLNIYYSAWIRNNFFKISYGSNSTQVSRCSLYVETASIVSYFDISSSNNILNSIKSVPI